MKKKIVLISAVVLMMFGCSLNEARAVNLPDPVVDERINADETERKIVVAGGCFWGIEAVFLHLKGVKNAVSGYAGGESGTAAYDQVSRGNTGHAEAVEITYDPQQVTMGTILKIFFSVAHDPTQLNAQGPDHGTQYRSAIFYEGDEQKEVARQYIDQIDATDLLGKKITTTLELLDQFYPAESHHQDYVAFHPDSMYVIVHDAPKLVAFEGNFPNLYVK
ncbi:MAG: peptide-methionine (S)-S-oxide reductase MsrA [Alphaproteobacteria bacterium]|nr:peptide-methionine (S)-S-oxide reductase MsrA [Alphaproteobacteria bacterium]